MVQCLHQHSIGYLGNGFTAQKTQPTTSLSIGRRKSYYRTTK